MPAYGFRLVMRNIPRNRILTDIRYRVVVRRTVGPSAGASVATLQDEELLQREDFYLFPGTDQLLLCFRLEERNESLQLIQTDRLGKRQREVILLDGDRVVCDYAAKLQNRFNFDVEIQK